MPVHSCPDCGFLLPVRINLYDSDPDISMAVSDAFVNLSVFRGRIRTGISKGLCEIDFSAVTQEIAWVEEPEDGAAPEA